MISHCQQKKLITIKRWYTCEKIKYKKNCSICNSVFTLVVFEDTLLRCPIIATTIFYLNIYIYIYIYIYRNHWNEIVYISICSGKQVYAGLYNGISLFLVCADLNPQIRKKKHEQCIVCNDNTWTKVLCFIFQENWLLKQPQSKKNKKTKNKTSTLQFKVTFCRFVFFLFETIKKKKTHLIIYAPLHNQQI